MPYVFVLIDVQAPSFDSMIIGIYENEDDAIKDFYVELKNQYKESLDDFKNWILENDGKKEEEDLDYIKSYEDAEYDLLKMYFEDNLQIIDKPLITSENKK